MGSAQCFLQDDGAAILSLVERDLIGGSCGWIECLRLLRGCCTLMMTDRPSYPPLCYQSHHSTNGWGGNGGGGSSSSSVGGGGGGGGLEPSGTLRPPLLSLPPAKRLALEQLYTESTRSKTQDSSSLLKGRSVRLGLLELTPLTSPRAAPARQRGPLFLKSSPSSLHHTHSKAVGVSRTPTATAAGSTADGKISGREYAIEIRDSSDEDDGRGKPPGFDPSSGFPAASLPPSQADILNEEEKSEDGEMEASIGAGGDIHGIEDLLIDEFPSIPSAEQEDG